MFCEFFLIFPHFASVTVIRTLSSSVLSPLTFGTAVCIAELPMLGKGGEPQKNQFLVLTSCFKYSCIESKIVWPMEEERSFSQVAIYVWNRVSCLSLGSGSTTRQRIDRRERKIDCVWHKEGKIPFNLRFESKMKPQYMKQRRDKKPEMVKLPCYVFKQSGPVSNNSKIYFFLLFFVYY